VRLIAFIEYAAIVAGIIAMIAGRFFALPPNGFDLGVFLIGAGIALGGIEAVLTRRMCFRASEDAYEAYAGAPALIVGLMALVLGVGTIASAYLLDTAQWHTTVHYLMRRPAPLLAMAGLFLIGIGVLMMLNPKGRSGWAWRIFAQLPQVLAGLVLIATGLASIGLGAWEWLEPRAFDDFVRRLPRFLHSFSRA
jgi:hypothetical protein